MTEVDPQVLTAAQWDEVSTTLVYIWVFVFFLGSFAGNLLIAHALIPSLAITGHVGRRVSALRPVFYSLAVVFVLATAWAVVNFVNSSEVLRTIYPKVWI